MQLKSDMYRTLPVQLSLQSCSIISSVVCHCNYLWCRGGKHNWNVRDILKSFIVKSAFQMLCLSYEGQNG